MNFRSVVGQPSATERQNLAFCFIVLKAILVSNRVSLRGQGSKDFGPQGLKGLGQAGAEATSGHGMRPSSKPLGRQQSEKELERFTLVCWTNLSFIYVVSNLDVKSRTGLVYSVKRLDQITAKTSVKTCKCTFYDVNFLLFELKFV